MTVSNDPLPHLSAGCEIRIPESTAKLEAFVSRWSNTQISLPAAVVVPATENDIIAVIHYASENGLKVIPANGTHGSFVPINERCVYLDMHKFNSIRLDEDDGTVQLGGGVITRDVMHKLGDEGFYTSVPNSNAVGMIGYCLGGGSSNFNGTHGLAIDNIVSIRFITSSGKVLDLAYDESERHPRERDLFNVLCGAGFGFGVISSLKMRAWHVDGLEMQDNNMWTRKLIFTPPKIQAAAELFSKLQRPAQKLIASLLFIRAPPSAPKPGAPMIVLSVTYLGHPAEAEKAAAATFKEEYTSCALTTSTDLAPLATMNDMSEPLNRHGDFKETNAAWVSSLSPSSIVSAFNSWSKFGDEVPSARAVSYVVFAAKSTQSMLQHDTAGAKFFPRELRGRNVFVQVTPWWTDKAAEREARAWVVEMLELVNAPQYSDGPVKAREAIVGDAEKKVTAFAANLSKGIDLTMVWPKEKIEEIRRIKQSWDPENVFWNPVVDGI